MTDTVRSPALLWLCVAYWAISGTLGIAPFVMVPSYLLQLQGPLLAFVVAAALSHVFSLAGAGLLAFRKKLAVPALVLVFVLGLGGLLAMGKSPLELNVVTQVLWFAGAATVVYAFMLVRRGVLR
jgi:hypothetical protein